MIRGGMALRKGRKRKGRKRNAGAHRDANGVSRDHEHKQKTDYEASLAVRAASLVLERVVPTEKGVESFADNRLAGFTLGKLYLRFKADRRDPSGISGKQFSWGNRWCGIIHAHSRVMGYRMSVKSPSFVMVGGGTGGEEPEPDAEEIAKVRDDFRQCYNALMLTCRDHGIGVSKVTYGVAVENWPLAALSEADFGLLRLGLNTLGTVFERPLDAG